MSNRQKLSLHVPLPHSRPGDRPDFSYLDLREAGATRRPDVLARETGMRDLPYGLVRVLGADGNAIGPWVPRLDPALLRRGLRAMLVTRMFDDRMFSAHRQGKVSFYMKSTGEEAVGAASAMVLGSGDMCFPTYRMVSYLI